MLDVRRVPDKQRALDAQRELTGRRALARRAGQPCVHDGPMALARLGVLSVLVEFIAI